MSDPSEKAIEAVWEALGRWQNSCVESDRPGTYTQRPVLHECGPILAAAHDPALGLDASVCKRDFLAEITERVRWMGQPRVDGKPLGEPNHIAQQYADFIEREFGGGS